MTVETRNVAELIQIDDEWLPGIAEYSCDLEDIDHEDTTRTESGILHRNRIREKVMKLRFSCNLRQEQVVSHSTAIGSEMFDATVLCPAHPSQTEGYVTAKFYVSKTSIKLLKLDSENYWVMTYNAIEV